MSGDNVDGSTNIIPKMDIDLLKRGYGQILSSIYGPKLFYERVKTFLEHYQPPQAPVRVEWVEIMAFFRSIYLLGIRGIERVHYWRLFFWALTKHPRKFPMAITFSIYGYHFRKVWEQQI
jgi:hypothetical protein